MKTSRQQLLKDVAAELDTLGASMRDGKRGKDAGQDLPGTAILASVAANAAAAAPPSPRAAGRPHTPPSHKALVPHPPSPPLGASHNPAEPVDDRVSLLRRRVKFLTQKEVERATDAYFACYPVDYDSRYRQLINMMTNMGLTVLPSGERLDQMLTGVGFASPAAPLSFLQWELVLDTWKEAMIAEGSRGGGSVLELADAVSSLLPPPTPSSADDAQGRSATDTAALEVFDMRELQQATRGLPVRMGEHLLLASRGGPAVGDALPGGIHALQSSSASAPGSGVLTLRDLQDVLLDDRSALVREFIWCGAQDADYRGHATPRDMLRGLPHDHFLGDAWWQALELPIAALQECVLLKREGRAVPFPYLRQLYLATNLQASSTVATLADREHRTSHFGGAATDSMAAAASSPLLAQSQEFDGIRAAATMLLRSSFINEVPMGQSIDFEMFVRMIALHRFYQKSMSGYVAPQPGGGGGGAQEKDGAGGGDRPTFVGTHRDDSPRAEARGGQKTTADGASSAATAAAGGGNGATTTGDGVDWTGDGERGLPCGDSAVMRNMLALSRLQESPPTTKRRSTVNSRIQTAPGDGPSPAEQLAEVLETLHCPVRRLETEPVDEWGTLSGSNKHRNKYQHIKSRVHQARKPPAPPQDTALLASTPRSTAAPQGRPRSSGRPGTASAGADAPPFVVGSIRTHLSSKETLYENETVLDLVRSKRPPTGERRSPTKGPYVLETALRHLLPRGYKSPRAESAKARQQPPATSEEGQQGDLTEISQWLDLAHGPRHATDAKHQQSSPPAPSASGAVVALPQVAPPPSEKRHGPLGLDSSSGSVVGTPKRPATSKGSKTVDVSNTPVTPKYLAGQLQKNATKADTDAFHRAVMLSYREVFALC